MSGVLMNIFHMKQPGCESPDASEPLSPAPKLTVPFAQTPSASSDCHSSTARALTGIATERIAACCALRRAIAAPFSGFLASKIFAGESVLMVRLRGVPALANRLSGVAEGDFHPFLLDFASLFRLHFRSSARDFRLLVSLLSDAFSTRCKPPSAAQLRLRRPHPSIPHHLRARSLSHSRTARRTKRQYTESHAGTLQRPIDRSRETFSRLKTRRSSTVVGSGCETRGGRTTACGTETARLELTRCVAVPSDWLVSSVDVLGSRFACVNGGGGASDDPFSSLAKPKL